MLSTHTLRPDVTPPRDVDLAKPDSPSPKARRGFARMDKDQQRQIARLGGQTAHQRGSAHQFTSEEAREAGKKGGHLVSQDRAHMTAIGRQGGLRRWRQQQGAETTG